MNKYSPEIAEAIKTYVKESDLQMVSFNEERGSFSFNLYMTAQISTVNIIIRVREDEFSTIAVCPVRPDIKDRELMARVAEFICRANFGLKNGNFEFDFSDGELRYKCYVPCGDHVPTKEIIRQSISTPASMFRRYAPGIIGVLYNGKDPAEMVQECENDTIGRRVYEEMQRSREELGRRFDSKAPAAGENSGALPSFDEFVGMDSRSNAGPDGADTPADPADHGGEGENEGNSEE